MSNKKFTLASPSITTASSRASSPPNSPLSASASLSDSDDDTSLPFPEPLPRSSFLTLPPGTFSPTAYLTSLGPRHQTLEDLRAELRNRSALLNRELLDLVNDHYEDFLNLGGSLKGGEERVEEVRVGLMALEREVRGVRDEVAQREAQVAALVRDRERVRQEMEVGRGLLEWCSRLESLEGKLGVSEASVRAPGQTPADEEAVESENEEIDEEEEESEEDDHLENDVRDHANSATVPLGKIKRRTHEFVAIEALAAKLGSEHPLLLALRPRVAKVRETLLLDMRTALKEAKSRGKEGNERLMAILELYRDLGAAKEAVNVVKGK